MIKDQIYVSAFHESVKQLEELGLHVRIRLDDLEIKPMLDNGGYYQPTTGKIQVGKDYLPAMAHEMYHKSAAEFVLNDDELKIFNDFRDSLVDKVTSEIVKRHNYFLKSFKKSNKSFTLENCFVVPCQESCQGVHCGGLFIEGGGWISVNIIDKPYNLVKGIYTFKNGKMEKRPAVEEYIDPFHFAEIFDDIEKYYISKVGPDYFGKAPLYPKPERNEETINIIEKFSMHQEKLRLGMCDVSELPAHLLQIYLENPTMLHDYKKLESLLSDRIYRSSGWGRSLKKANKFAEDILKIFKNNREKGSSIEDSVAECIKFENLFSFKDENTK